MVAPLVVLLAVLIVAVYVTTGLMHLALMLLFAGFIGWGASSLVSGRGRSFGCLGSTVAGLLGGWLGHLLMGNVGPGIFGVRVIPAFVGALLVALLANIVFRRSKVL